MTIEPETAQALAAVGGALVQVILPVITILGGLAMAEVRKWLAAHAHNTQIDGAMKVLTDLVTMVVRELEQTTLATLRANNGKLDEQTAKRAKEAALAQIRLLYGPEGLKRLAQRLGTSEDATLRLIGGLIEQAVYLLKNPPPAPLPLPLPGTGSVFDPNVFGGMTTDEKDAQAAKERLVAATAGEIP